MRGERTVERAADGSVERVTDLMTDLADGTETDRYPVPGPVSGVTTPEQCVLATFVVLGIGTIAVIDGADFALAVGCGLAALAFVSVAIGMERRG
ncbi:hypothetical protein [Natronorarus salvus]|uniref:hypothetical protein n=1 Tax=Natronorarus salvus TaxID=3117733 RepID=UPI002F262A53